MLSERTVVDSFHPRPATRWSRTQVGGGQLIVTDDGLRLWMPAARADTYTEAQIDDYAGLPRRHFPWRPPLRLTVRARFSHSIAGTAGFGFWNHPFAPVGGLPPALPAAIWFFYAAPPTDLPLATGVSGHGWKAACIDATQPQALMWAPLAPPVLLLNHMPPFYRTIWPRVQRSLSISEALLDDPDETWHSYTLEWRKHSARLAVDGVCVLETDRAPRGPLGFVAWIDNQWAIATPWGRFGWGLRQLDRSQWMDLGLVQIEPL